LVKKGKVREEDVKQAWTSDWYLAVLCSYHRIHGRQAGCCLEKGSCATVLERKKSALSHAREFKKVENRFYLFEIWKFVIFFISVAPLSSIETSKHQATFI
jgi:hypothetical protein